ncbi:hypothetical protein F2Q69_00027282 [Brassica cretica]|uniref:Uncharacterized protein n=1 Tax=Brassica cretica TaxID=69181 RepID=A0A8S9SCE1_BRACR|nr:hypothetical protein F2Q69_00027282 [Brassica cretica]
MFSEFELLLGFEDCRTGPPREPRARRDTSWNKLERELQLSGMAGADRMNTSWNACKNRLGFVGFGLGFQSKSARTVSAPGVRGYRADNVLQNEGFRVLKIVEPDHQENLELDDRTQAGTSWNELERIRVRRVRIRVQKQIGTHCIGA